MMLGVSVVSAKDVTNQTTSTEQSVTAVTHQEINEINTLKEVAKSNDEITHTDTAANTTKKSIKKVASKAEDLKTSEPPSADGYNLYNIASASEFTRQGAKVYYNLTDNIIFTGSTSPALTINNDDDVVINGNGFTISYSGTDKVHFIDTNSRTTKVTMYNVNVENFTNSVIWLGTSGYNGPGEINITNCTFRNNVNPDTGNQEGGGGVIRCSYVSKDNGYVLVQDSRFINNSAVRGGAIFYNDPVNMNFTGCYFANNSVWGNDSYSQNRNGGGAIYAEDGSAVTLINSEFENNLYYTSAGVASNNSIAVYGNTGVKGYNIKVNGIYVTNLTNNSVGIYAQNQNVNYGFHGDVTTYDTTTEIMADETYINDTIYITIHTIEEGFNSSLSNPELHITITAPNGDTVVDEDVTADEDGYLYYDFTSDIKGIYQVTSNIKEIHGKVLRKENNVQFEDIELIYRGSTTTKSLNYYRINTTTSTEGNVDQYTGKAYSSKNYTVNVVDANGNPVTDGEVQLIDADGINQTKTIDDGQVNFTYNFTHKGTYSFTFNYVGTELVYNASSFGVTTVISPVDSTISVDVPDDISVLEPFTLNLTLTNENGEGLADQPVTVYVNDVLQEGTFVTNASGELPITYTPGDNSELNIRIVYSGTVDINSKEFTTTIPSSNIRTIDTEIGVDFTGNATIDEDFVITVNLTGNGELIDPSNLTVYLGVEEADSSMLTYDTDAKLLYITICPDEVKPYNFEVTYNGVPGVYNPADDQQFTINVNLIPVKVYVNYAEVDPESVILMIRFTDPDDNPINEGIFHVNMNNSEAERQDFDTQNLNDPNYKWPINVDENGTYYVDVGSKFYREDGFPYAFVTFNGTNKYARSTARKGEMEVKTDITVNIYTYEDSALTTRKDTFYIGDDVYIYLDLVNNLGFKQNGDVGLTIYNNRYQDQAVEMPDEHASNSGGLVKIFNNMTSGEYTIVVDYKGSGAYNPTVASKTFTLIKLESNSVVEVKNKTAGNVTLGVKVTDKDNQVIQQGKITVEVDGVPKVVEYNLADGEDEVIINLNDLGVGIRTTDPVDITVTYQGDDKYSDSEAYDKESIDAGNPTVLSSITADKGTSIINVNIEPEDIDVGSQLSVYGNLTDVDGSPIMGGSVNVTIKDADGNIVFSQNVTTNGRGYYSLDEVLGPDTYPAGDYTVEVSFYDKDHETKTVTKDLTVSKVATNVDVIPLNTTVGNLTVRVMVSDDNGRPIKEGTVNITDADGNTIKTVELDGTSPYVDVVIDSITTNDPVSLIVNYNGTPMYADASNSDALKDLELTTRSLSINASVENNTYGNTSIKVNITDETTGNGISGVGFNILDDDGNVVGTGQTGNDGTVVVKVDVPVGEDQKLIVVFPTGDETYSAKEEELTVNVIQRETSLDAELINTTAGNVTVRVSVTDATNGSGVTSGRIIITDNDVVVADYSYSDVESGIVEVLTDISDSTGEHNLVVQFTGNTEYKDQAFQSDALSGITVDKRTASIVDYVLTNATVGNTSVSLKVVDEDGTTGVANAIVNVYSDEEQTVLVGTGVTDADGNLIIDLTVPMGTENIYINFTGNSTYESTTLHENVQIIERNSSVMATVTNNTAGNTTVHVEVKDPVTGDPITEGYVNVTLNGVLIGRQAVGSDGTVNITTSIDAVTTDAIDLTVNYERTTNYASSSYTIEDVEVVARNASIIAEVSNSTFGNVTISVDIVDSTTGESLGLDKVNVTVNGQTTELPVTEGKVTVPLSFSNDPQDIKISYAGDETFNYTEKTVTVTTLPREVSIDGFVSNTTAGNITVKVNITDAATEEFVPTGIINITSNGKVVATVDLENDALVFDEDGLLVINTNITDALTYTLSVNYDGTPTYEVDTFQLESFTASYKESNLTAAIPNTTKGNTTLYVNLTDPVTGEKLDGKVYVSIDGGKNTEYTLTDGKIEELLDLSVGEHTITVLYNGNNTYDESTATITLEVEPREVTIDAEFTNTTQGNVTIKVTAVDDETGEGVNGTVELTLPDGSVIPVEVVNGEATAVLDIPVNGDTSQGVTVKYLEDENYPETILADPVTLTVTKRDSEVTAELGSASAGNTTVIVTVRDPVTGEPITSGRIIVTDGDDVVYNDTFNSETGIVEVLTNITSSGPHKLNVTFTGNENYTDANYTDNLLSNVNVANRTADMTIVPVNNTFDDTSIKVTLVDSVTGGAIEGGVVEVYLEGVTDPVGTGTTNEDGSVTIKLDVPVDATEVTVKYIGNESNYDALEESYSFSIEPRSVSVNASVINTTAGNVTVKVNVTDAATGEVLTSGIVTITDNKGNVVASVDLGDIDSSVARIDDDGLLVVYTDIEETGRYKLSVNYDGRPEFDEESYNLDAFDAEAKESKLTVDVPVTTKGNTTVNVTLTDPVTGENITGTVKVFVNGEEVDTIDVVDGVGGKLLDLPVGDNTIKVVFEGDEKYASTEVETDNPIVIEPREITVQAAIINTTQGNVTIEVNVTDTETGEAINGEVNVTLPDGTNVTVPIVGGKGQAVLDIPISNQDITVDVTYPADGVNKETKVTTEPVTIGQRESNVTAEVSSKVANKTEVSVTVTDPVTGQPVTSGDVTVSIDGQEIGKLPVGEDGTVVIPVDLPNKGIYTLDVTYGGNENYTSSSIKLEDVEILGSQSEFIVDVVNTTQGNVTVKVNLTDPVTGEELPLTAVNVTLPDGSIEEFPVVDGNIVVPLDVGDNEITISYPGDDTYNATEKTLTIDVTSREAVIDAIVSNKTAGNVTVKVNITDATTGERITEGIVNVTLGGEVVGTIDLGTATVLEDGTIEIVTDINKTGKYTLTVEFGDNENYTNSYINLDAFDAVAKESNITATVPVAIKGNTTVNVTFTDPVTGELLNGTVYVSVNGSKPVPVEVENGKGGIPLDLPVGTSTINVTFDGDEKYNETRYGFEVEVAPRAIDMAYEITNHTQGNVTIQVTVNDTETKEGINGIVIVKVGDEEVPVEIKDGVGTAVLDIPITGGEISVSYPADDTYEEIPASTPEHVDVNPRDSSVTAAPGNTDAGNTTVIVTVTDPVTGEPITSGRIIVTDGDDVVYNDTFNSQTGIVEVLTNITSSGPHKLNVTFTGNENYTDANYTDDSLSNIVITNRTAVMDIIIVNNTFANTTINVTVTDSVTGDALPEGGVVEVYLEGESEPVGTGTIGADGKTNITFNVPIDTDSVTVKYLGNATSYDPKEESLPLSLDKRASNVTAEVTNTTAGNITVKVNVTDLTTGESLNSGTVNITLNGEVVGTADLSTDLLDDGTVVIYTDIQTTGNYQLVAKYSGDENHTEQTFNIEAFDSIPKESNITAAITNLTKGNTTLDVTFVDPVTGEGLNGIVYVSINGSQPGRQVKIQDGKPVDEVLLDLPVGDSTIKVTFDGDKKYNATEFEFEVTVEPRSIIVEADFTNSTQGNITLEINVTDATTGEGITGTIEVTLPNGTVVPVDVVGGKASPVLDIPITDSGNPLTIRYPADGVNEETTITTNTLTIQQRESNVTAEVSNKVANKTEVSVTVTDPVTGQPVTSGYVTVTLDGQEIGKLPVGEDGTVVIPVDLPTKGTYSLNVTYEGNENFTGSSTILEDVEILGSESEFIVDIVNTTQGNVTVKVNLTDPVTGEELPISAVNVTLPDGTTEEFPIDEDGNIIIPLGVGDNEITISYPGDDTYNSTNVTLSIPVQARDVTVGVNVTNATAGNTTVKVNVTDTVTGEPVTSGEVSITVNGEEVGRLPVGEDGTVSIPTSIAKTGVTSIVATYEGNENYTSKSVTAENVNILPKESKITAELSDSTQGDTTLKVELFDPVTGEGLDGKVTVTMAGATPVEANVVGGIVEIPVDLPVGESTLKVSYLGNQTYDSVQYEVPVTVNQRPTKVDSSITNDVAGDVTVAVKVVDQLTNQPLSTGSVLVMNGDEVVGTGTLDENGEATIKTNITKSDEYDLTIVYNGDINHSDNTTKTGKVKVTPRESNVTANVTNTNVGLTEVNITITDSLTNASLDGEVIVTLPDGTNITATAENGSILVPVDLPVGDNTVTVTYPGNETYDEVVIQVPIKVNKRETNSEVSQLSNDAGNVTYEVKVTDEASDEPINAGEVTISVNGEVVGKAPVKDGVAIVNTNIAKAGNYTLDIKYGGTPEYESTEETLDETVEPREINVDVKILNNTVEDTKIQVNVTDAKTGKAVPNETVTVTLPNGTKIGVTTDSNGLATVDTELLSGDNTITVTVDKNDVFNTSTTTVKTSVEKIGVRVVVDSVTGIVGEKITLTAHITDEYGKAVSGGNLVFKLNGRTLRTDGRFDTNDTSPLKISVKNGLVTFTMTADLYLRAGKNITASYSGSYMYESAKANVAEANIKKRSASIDVETNPQLVKQDKNIVFKAKVTDVTSGSSKSMVNDNAYVLFKINGKTLKDSKGQNIKVNVTRGVAKYTYHVPLGTSGMVDGHMRDYMVTAVYSNDNYYPDVKDTVAYNVERSPTKINITSATVKNDKLSIKANILDQYGNNVIGKNTISIKINGKTFKVDGKSATYTVNDGKINIAGMALNGNKVKSLTIITGERQSYYESQVTTKNVKTIS